MKRIVYYSYLSYSDDSIGISGKTLDQESILNDSSAFINIICETSLSKKKKLFILFLLLN